MGYYDARCMVTGVSLKGSGAALVLLQQWQASYRPVALAIKGQYDRLGSIDAVDEDENSALVLRYFLDQLSTGAFTVDRDYLAGHRGFPIETTEHLLRGFERNMNDGDTARLCGQPVVFALVAATVWNAIARPARSPVSDDKATFRKLFNAVPVASQIYGERLGDVSGHIRELAAVSDFLAQRDIGWAPATDLGQHYREDMRQYLAEARASFHDSVAVLDGLNMYEVEVSDLLED